MPRRLKREPPSHVALRPWTRSERKVVLRGFLGRLAVAIEPLLVAGFFSLLPVGLLLRKQEVALLLAPIFAGASLGFLIYAIALMVPCGRAMLETFSPIRIVDGYVRYRRSTEDNVTRYYVAVLSDEQELLGEWPLGGWPPSIRERTLWPAHVEFSDYGGIHRIDGLPTGVLPDRIPALGIGVAQSEEPHETA